MQARTFTALFLLTAASYGFADTLVLPFDSNNGNAGNMFNISVLGVNNVTLTGHFAVNIGAEAAGVMSQISVYYKTGTYVGSETTSAAWTLLGTDNNAVGAGVNLQTPINVGNTAVLTAGQTYGFYVFYVNWPTVAGNLNYTNTTGVETISDAHLSFASGVGRSWNADPFAGGTNLLRRWNGTIEYNVNPVPEPVSLLTLAIGSGLAVTRRRRKTV